MDQRFAGKKDDPTKTLIATPLIYNSEVIGVIEVVNKTNPSEKYTDGDRFFLEDLSTLVAMHIKTSRSLKDQEKLFQEWGTSLSSMKSSHRQLT